MNKLITISILTSMAFSTFVQFNVDMSQEDVGEEGPTLWMGAFYPDPGFVMEDPDGDGVWTLLLELDPGTYTYKYRNGYWTEWNTGSGWEDLLGQDCAVGQWSDREVVVGSDNLQIDSVCFSSCTAECMSVNSYDVTFQVDMNGVDGFNPADGVYVQGTFNGWCGYCNPMSDDNGDYLYTLTIPIPDSEYEYLYTTNGWNGMQGGAPIGSECDYLPDDEFGNYGFIMSGQNLVLDVIPFGECPGSGGGTGGGDDIYTVTFDLDGVDDCVFVSVTGTWDSWSGWGANTDTGMAADIPAGDHEFVILCVNTEGEWWNDIWGNSTVYNAPIDGSCWNGNAEFANYALTVDSDQTVSYCAGSCDATCGGGGTGGGDDIYTVTFDLDGVDDCGFVSVTGTWDSWSGWGANTDTGMAADIPAGDHEFVILCVNTEGEWWNDIWGSSSIINAPIDGSCWNGNAEFANYALTVDSNQTVSYCAGSCDATCTDPVVCGTGDINDDGTLNVLDIVTMVQFILGEQTPTGDQLCIADLNGDEGLDVLDIVIAVNIILNPRTSESAEKVKLNQSISGLSFEADGYVGAIQLAITHEEDFKFSLTEKAFIADYKTDNNNTTIIVVNPQDCELFTSEGPFNIENVVAASVDGYIDTQINMPTGFIIGNAYPNPFNPSTSIFVNLSTDSNVSVKVFNLNGQLIDILSQGQKDAGAHSFTWDASNHPSGIYIISSLIDDNSQVQKVMLVK
jgi:hypothetical protein